jgi:hypothetical protein
MSIQKKSLISTLKTAKKANVAREDHAGSASPAVKSPSPVFKSPRPVLKSPSPVLKSPRPVLKSPTKIVKHASIKLQ